ncbi:methyltransferase domain-containing protein [Catenulispora sp. NF23]|uniref:methyltransferase domain-containing protein n=1 Tax=Catenulispora pinistramenti TaxID=2705254 RepID=UPI001BAE49D9|nr:methyltransferase domain-containing protein [Catenulispora pinistramenti]MBS2531814.1 methyltransferase domain-containing protein [Catenulispora pinistramenti]
MTSSVASSAPASYLDAVAATDAARSYKRALLAALAVEPGHQVLDVGCGPGTDLAALADAAGATGAVFGIDQDPRMVATAQERMADRPTVAVRQADAQQLPFDTHSIDRARADRVLMHVADPAAVLGEIHRVLRPGGLLTLAEPDWDTLAIDHPDLAVSRAFTGYVAERLHRNRAIGRQLPRLAAHAGFSLRAVRNEAVVLTDFGTAETILGLRRNTERAAAAGFLTPEETDGWLEHLRTDTFFATASFITVVAQSAT